MYTERKYPKGITLHHKNKFAVRVFVKGSYASADLAELAIPELPPLPGGFVYTTISNGRGKRGYVQIISKDFSTVEEAAKELDRLNKGVEIEISLEDLLKAAEDSSLIDERGYDGPSDHATEYPVTPDGPDLGLRREVFAVEAYAHELRTHDKSEAADQLLALMRARHGALLSKQKTNLGVGKDFDTVHYITGESAHLEVKPYKNPELTKPQGFTAYADLRAYIIAIVNDNDGTVQFFDWRGTKINKQERITYRYKAHTLVPMSDVYLKDGSILEKVVVK